MFSRAAKSVVKSCGSRWIHIGEKNFKIALIDDAGGISQTLSQLLRNSAKLNAVALYNVSAVNKPLPNYYFFNGQPISSEALTMPQKCCSGEGSCSNAAKQTENNNHQGNDGKSQTEKLVEALYRLPIAEEAPAFNSPLIPIEEIVPKLQGDHLTVRVGESGITDERRERSSSSMKSAVEIAESGKLIKANQIQTRRRSLSISNSREQFINYVKDFQQDPNSTINHTDCFDFSLLDKHFATKSRDYKFEDSKSHGNKQSNDDYFPQGEEYEDEIGQEKYQPGRKTPSKKAPSKSPPSYLEDEYDNFKPSMLVFESNKSISGGPLMRFITRVHFSSEKSTEADRTMPKKVSKDPVEKLQTLIEKVTEFKRRVFRPKRDASKTGATTDEEKKEETPKKTTTPN